MSSTATKIQWTDATWNPTRGCSRVSEGCRHCYAERTATRFAGPGGAYAGLATMTRDGPRWTGRVVLDEDALSQPLRWRRGRRVFVDSMSDLFHEALTFEQVDLVFAVMALAPRHTFQVLTKRAERMREYMEQFAAGERHVMAEAMDLVWVRPELAERAGHLALQASGTEAVEQALGHVWLGVSVEDQATADARLPHLVATRGGRKFVSYEPALERVNFGRFLWMPSYEDGRRSSRAFVESLWLIVGGESGPHARPFELEWARATVRQCRDAGVPCFVKQLGANPHGQWVPGDKGSIFVPGQLRQERAARQAFGSLEDFPDDLRVRELPT